jgi:hypothetical protein
MAYAAGKQEEVLRRIRQIYADAEVSILSRMAKLLISGPDNVDHWTTKKLADIRRNMAQIEGILKQLDGGVSEEALQAITNAYINGYQAAATSAASAGITTTGATVTAISQVGAMNLSAVNALASAAAGNLSATHLPILRSANDVYRRAIFETASLVSTGTMTRKQATQAALNKMADAGLSGFVDAKGRKWDMASYAEMSIRSAVVQASVDGHVKQLSEYGRNLVIVSEHTRECPLCRPWEGKVLCTDGSDPKYPTLAAARTGGLFHPNCGHTISIYIDGVTEIPKNTEDPIGYAAQQKQRYNERAIRKWKKREAVAVLPEDQAFARSKVRSWQQAQRKHLDGKDLPRKYDRERIRV